MDSSSMIYDYIAHLSFESSIGPAVTLTLCNVLTQKTHSVNLRHRIPEFLKSKEDLHFAVSHVTIDFYKTLMREDQVNLHEKVPHIGAVDERTFYSLRACWPNVTYMPITNLDEFSVKLITNDKPYNYIVNMTFDKNTHDPLTLYLCETKEPFEGTFLNLNSSDDPIYENVKKMSCRTYEVRHRIIDFYRDDWNVATTEEKTFQYLKTTWPKITYLGGIDIEKALVKFNALKYKPTQ